MRRPARLLLILALLLVVVVLIGVTLFRVAPWNRPRDAAELLPTLYAAAYAKTPAPPLTPAPPTATPAIADLQALLRDPDWRARTYAANVLAGRSDIPAEQRTGLIVDALAGEIAQPNTQKQPEGAYLSTSALLRLQYARSLGFIGKDGLPALQQAAAGKSGEVREWIILGLGYAGAPDIAPQLRDLLSKSQHGEVRTFAAYQLGELKDRQAIQALQAAVTNDPFKVSYPLNGEQRTLYPVRAQAASALEKLGFQVEMLDDNTYRVANP